MTGPDYLDIPVRITDFLADGKVAVFMDGVLHISPAMHRLMVGASCEELMSVLASLNILNIDELERQCELQCLPEGRHDG
jgi:hypothetical protein